eukprot:403345150
MDRKILLALRQRNKYNPNAYSDVPKEFVMLIQKTKEFRDLSIMAIGEIFKEIEIIDLYRDVDQENETSEQAYNDYQNQISHSKTEDSLEIPTQNQYESSIKRQQSSFEIKDQVYLDFFILIAGKCELNFEVTKIFDPNQTEEDIRFMTQEDIERKDQTKILQRLGTKLNKLLVKPYFQTEAAEVEDQRNLLQKDDPNIIKLAQEYLKDPNNEQPTFNAYSNLLKFQTLSDFSINFLRPNYFEYYKKVYEIVTKQLSNMPMAKFPRKVNKFEDRLLSISTIEQKSTLLRLPYKKMIRIVQSFWSNYNQFSDLLYNHVPLLSTYTLKQKERMIQTFQEENFNPNQPLFKENTQLQYIYLIAKGQIRLTTTSNPYTQKYYKQLKLNENTEKLLLKNSAGIGNLSKTTIENNIGLVQQGQWLGEEFVLMNLPLLYSAVAVDEVKVLKVSITDFKHKFTAEIHQLMQGKTMEKLDWIRQRLEICHKIRKEIQGMDTTNKTFESTFNHVQQNYPLSSTQTLHNIRKAIMKQTCNNPNLLMFTQNKRIEKKREDAEQLQGTQSFKSYIVEQEHVKTMKLKLARALRKTLGVQKEGDNNNYQSIIKLKIPQANSNEEILDYSDYTPQKSRNNLIKQNRENMNLTHDGVGEYNLSSELSLKNKNHNLSDLKINVNFDQTQDNNFTQSLKLSKVPYANNILYENSYQLIQTERDNQNKQALSAVKLQIPQESQKSLLHQSNTVITPTTKLNTERDRDSSALRLNTLRHDSKSQLDNFKRDLLEKDMHNLHLIRKRNTLLPQISQRSQSKL